MKRSRGPARSREGYHWFRGWRRPTVAQRRVLDELVAGGTNAQIAGRLGISEDGVKWHLSELRDEIGLADRRELAEWWTAERQRPAVNLLLPLVALRRFVTQNSTASFAVAGVVAAAVMVGWLAYESLAGDEGAATNAQAAATAERPASIPFVPTPTPTPLPRGALVFDIGTRSATLLPGDYFDRRWLDPEAGTFSINDGQPAVIDANGNVRTLSDRTSVSVQPVPGSNDVVVWGWGDGVLSVIDATTGAESRRAEFGPAGTSRRDWALTAAGGLLALSEAPYDAVTLYELDGSNPRRVFTVEQGSIRYFDWTRDGSRLLIVTAEGSEPAAPAGEHSVVIDAEARVVFEYDGSASWAGDNALQLYSRATVGGRADRDAVVDLTHGGEIPVPDGNLICISPDNRYAVVIPPSSASRRPAEHQLVDLVTREVVASAVIDGILVNCDWTPDGSRVVLSGGGK